MLTHENTESEEIRHVQGKEQQWWFITGMNKKYKIDLNDIMKWSILKTYLTLVNEN